MRSPRISVKAVIIQNGRVLALTKHGLGGDFYVVPGGGQNRGESLPKALQRECLEEVGLNVDVGQLLFVRDYIAANHEPGLKPPDHHQVDVFFQCTIREGAPCEPTHPDKLQVGTAWLPLTELPKLALFPSILRTRLAPGLTGQPAYLGDVN
jgi:ADP-ribose pyrophosphatase YjhB (NUDIX family)